MASLLGSLYLGADPKALDGREEIDDSKAKFRQEGIKLDKAYALGEILEHPELFKRHPELKTLPVVFGSSNAGIAGMASNRKFTNFLRKYLALSDSDIRGKKGFHHTKGGMAFNAPGIVWKSKERNEPWSRSYKRTGIHELQHILDYIYGFKGEDWAYDAGDRINMSSEDRAIVPKALSRREQSKALLDALLEQIRVSGKPTRHTATTKR